MEPVLPNWPMRGLSRRGPAQGERERIDIVIIDDDAAASAILGLLLRVQGYAAVSAHDGPSGIARVLQTFPSLVIIDVMMPDMDGWKVLLRHKNDKATWSIPVVMYSALDEPVYREKAARMGAIDYWPKADIDSDHVRRSLERLLKGKARPASGDLSAAG